MLSRILGLNRKVLTLNELHIFGDIVSVDQLKSTASDKQLIKISGKIIARQKRSILDDTITIDEHIEACRLIASLPTSNRTYKEVIYAVMSMFSSEASVQIVCEHTPRNIFYSEKILNFFPSAKILHIIRDPRAVLASQKNCWKRRKLGARNIPLKEMIRLAINYHPLTMAKMWQKANNKAGLFRDHSRFKIVRFEDLLESPKDTVLTVCEFVGVEFSENMLEVKRVGSSNRKDLVAQKGIDKSVAEQWRGILTKGELMLCEFICSDEMNKYGYKKIAKHTLPTYLSIICSLMLYPLNLAGVFLINPRRALIQFKAIFNS